MPPRPPRYLWAVIPLGGEPILCTSPDEAARLVSVRLACGETSFVFGGEAEWDEWDILAPQPLRIVPPTTGTVAAPAANDGHG